MGIVGPQLYQSKFGPTYRVSYGSSIGLLSCTMMAIGVTWFLVRKGDRKRARETEGRSVEA
jgi:hypothetical protein